MCMLFSTQTYTPIQLFISGRSHLSSPHLHLPNPKPVQAKLSFLSALIVESLVWSLNPCLLQANGNRWCQPANRLSIFYCKINILLFSSAKVHFPKQHNSRSENPQPASQLSPNAVLPHWSLGLRRHWYGSTGPSQGRVQIPIPGKYLFQLLFFMLSLLWSLFSQSIRSRCWLSSLLLFLQDKRGSNTLSLGMRPQLGSCRFFISHYSL